MADSRTQRPAIVIRTIEGGRSVERPVLTAARYKEQVGKLAKSGVRVPRVRSK